VETTSACIGFENKALNRLSAFGKLYKGHDGPQHPLKTAVLNEQQALHACDALRPCKLAAERSAPKRQQHAGAERATNLERGGISSKAVL